MVAVKGLLLRPATDLTIELSVHRNVSGSAAAISGIGIAGECAGDVNRKVSEALGYY